MDVSSSRGLVSSGSLLASSLSSGVQRLERSKRIDSRSIPKTSSRVMLPLDAALQELSQSLSESSFHQMMDDRPSTSLSSMSHPSVWQASSHASVRRPWTTQGVGEGGPRPGPSAGGGGGRRKRGQVAAPTQSPEEVRLESMLREKESSLEREGLRRAALSRDGLNGKQASRLYRLLYLHSCSLQDVLLDTTDHCSATGRGPVLLKIWKVFVWLVEYLMAERASTQFSMALQQSSDAMSMLQERCDEEEARCDELTGTLEAATLRTHALENEVRELHSQLETSQSTAKTEAKHTAHKAKYVMEQAQSMLQEGDAYSQQLYTTLTEEREARLQVQAALVEKGAECEEMEKRLANTRRTVGPLEAAGRQSKAERAKAEAELVRTRAAISQLTGALTSERESLHAATRKLAEMEAANAELTKERDALAKELTETQQKLETSDGLAARFKARLALEKTRNAKLAQQLDEASTVKIRAEEVQAEVEATHAELSAAHEEVTAERDELKERAESAEERVDELETQASVLEKELSTATKERARVQQELDLMHAKMEHEIAGGSQASGSRAPSPVATGGAAVGAQQPEAEPEPEAAEGG
jgi:chromosome segregation ATPase